MPTGCNQALVETQTPTVWFVDPARDAVACAGRVATYIIVPRVTGSTIGEPCGPRLVSLAASHKELEY
jgi:hypothetical protein